MTQYTHDTNGPGLPEYPTDLKVADVNVYMHDSGMIATHDYSCPVCREMHAVLDLSDGLMKPCRVCEQTYELRRIDRRPWWKKFLARLGDIV